MLNSYDKNTLVKLCEEAVEGRLTPERMHALEQITLAHPSAMEFYANYVAQHAALLEIFAPHCADAGEPLWYSGTSRRFRLGGKVLTALSVLTLGLLVALVFWSLHSGPEAPAPLQPVIAVSPTEQPPEQELTATVLAVEAEGFGHFQLHGDKSDSDAVIKDGLRIGTGSFRLERGYAQIFLDHGVVLTVEAPAHLTFQSIDRCFLHSGRVVAKVSPEGIGFTIETPIAEIRDLGTEFGVSVGEGENADVQVFSGRVDVVKKDQTRVFPIKTGGWLRFDTHSPNPLNPNILLSGPTQTGDATGITCTTASGKSQEACIIRGGTVEELKPRLKSDSQIYTLLKNGESPEWQRKAYFSIDLSSLTERPYRNVQLELAFAPTGVGIQAFTPEVSTFSVYGLTDESRDHWTEASIDWAGAPGNGDGAAEVNPETTVKIATFEIPREEEAARIIIAGDALKRFLASDTNQIVTFIIVRDTGEEWHSGYAHGFANRHHPQLPPPTLRFFP